jgi:hypothetical protein
MRFLFTTLDAREGRFYLRVADELRRRGHEVAQLTWSPLGARDMRKAGQPVDELPSLVEQVPAVDIATEALRIEGTYDILSLRDVYRTDVIFEGRPEAECIERTVRQFLAVERVLDERRPDVVVPEVGSETIRTVVHAVALQRGIDVLFPFYTIFPDPLRLYVNTMHAPIVPESEVRPLSPEEDAELDRFIDGFIERNRPIRDYRRPRVHAGTLRDFAGHLLAAAGPDRGNPYLRPQRFVTNYFRDRSRARLARSLYEPLGDDARPFVYFPLHVTTDYKIKRVIPHCVDQAAIIELIADALPQGIDLVLKEHPMSVGRNTLAFLRRLRERDNVRLVDPHTSSHELIRRAQAIAVISSTVGLEALLHDKPVLTCGQPFYSGYGATLDVDSFREMPAAVNALLEFEPDRERTRQFLHAAMRACLPGKTVTVDDSDENARAIGASFDTAVGRRAGGASRAPL